MQLKTVGESTNVLSTIQEVLNANSHLGSGLNDTIVMANKLSEAISSYSTEAIKMALVESNLNEIQIKAILSKKGLKGEVLETTAAEIAEKAATKGVAAAQAGATGTTTGLTTAFKGLKTVLMQNPFLIVAAGVTVAIAAFNAFKQHQEDLAQTTGEAAREIKSQSEELDSYAEQYSKLHDELIDANTTEERQTEIKKELLSIQQDLNDKYGEEYGRVNLVTDAYKDQIDTLKKLKSENALQWLADNNEGIELATKKMEEQKNYNLGQVISPYTESGRAIKDIASKYEDRGLKIDEDESSGTYSISIKADATNAKKVIDDFKKDVYVLKKQFKDDSLIDSVLNTSGDASKQVNKILDKYQEIYEQAKLNSIASDEELSAGYESAIDAVEKYNEALASGDETKIKEARAELDRTRNSIDLNTDTWREYAYIINNVFDQADTRIVDFKEYLNSLDGEALVESLKGMAEVNFRAMADDGDNGDAVDNLINKANEQGIDSLEEIISLLIEIGIIIPDIAKKSTEMAKPFTKSEMISAINSMSEGFEELDKIYESISDKDPFDFKLLDDDKFKNTFSKYKDEYTNFVEIVSNSPDNINACKGAFDDLVTVWLKSTGILDNVSENTKTLTIAMLENMGISNATQLVTQALEWETASAAAETNILALNQEYLSATGNELTDQTWDAISAFIDEQSSLELTGQASEFAKQKLAELKLAQLDLSNNKIDLSTNISEILTYAKAAKVAQSNINQLSRLQVLQDKYQSGKMAQSDFDEYRDLSNKLSNDTSWMEAEVKFDPVIYNGGNKSNKKSGSGSGSSKQDKTFDWIQRKIEYLRDEYNKYKEEVDDTNNSYRTQLNYLSQAKDLLGQIIDADKQAESAYLQNWEEVSAGISDELKDKIMSGHYSIDYFKDSEAATKAKEAWDSYYDQYQKRLEDEKAYQDLAKSERDKKNEWDREQIDNLKEKADIEQTNYQVQQDYLDQAVSKSEELTSRLRGYSEEANKNWDNAKSKIKSLDIADIMNGTMDLTKYKDDPEYKKLVEDAIKAYEDKTDAERELQDEERELEEIRKEAYEKAIAYVEAQQDAIQELNNTLQSEMDLLEATGKYIGADYYEDLIDNNKDLIDLYEEQIELAQDRLDEVSEESPEYYQLKGTIEQCTQAILDVKAQQAEWNETIKRLPIDRLQTYIDLLENIKQDLQNFTDENSVLGLKPTKEQYQQFIDINQEQLDSLIKQQEKLKDILGDYEYGSEKYNDVSGEIQDIDDQISSLIQSQLEYNDAILQIPITEMENYYNNLSAAKTALENAIAEDNAKGLSTTIDQYNELHNITLQQLQALSARRDALTSLLSVYDKESDKYRETQDAINSINSEMSSLVQNQYQWNQEILNIPIDKLNAINDNLNSYASILDGVISDYESAITGVNSLLDDEIDKINELRDATEEEYEAKIKPLEDELNLLEKTNEARSVQIGLEQAQYNLEKVQNQKTTQVKLIA